jgi:anti-sigma B factor antagonist
MRGPQGQHRTNAARGHAGGHADGEDPTMRMLHAAVTAGPSGPVIALAGEADLTTAAELNQLLAAQLDGGTTLLTVDLSGLRFADSAAIRELIHAHRAITQRGGTLELTRPQPVVARVLSLLGVDQILTVRDQAGTAGA